MAYTQLKLTEQEALKNQQKLNVSSEAQVFLAFKYKASNRYKLLGQLTSKITNCLEKQNRNILKQLRNLLEFKYQRKYLEHNHCYMFKINPKVNEILESSAVKKGGVL